MEGTQFKAGNGDGPWKASELEAAMVSDLI
jgi:hypothetical protein